MKVPIQNYVFSAKDKCPHCDGKFERGVLLTDPPQLECSQCRKLVNLYSWVEDLLLRKNNEARKEKDSKIICQM